MREYLFHGKRLDNGEWVEGGSIFRLINKIGEHFFIPQFGERLIATHDDDMMNIVALENMTMYRVDPETVGQYTGLENMNGVKIFDGDIVMFHEKKYIVRREDEIPGGYWWSTAYILQEVGVDDYLSFEETVDEYCNEICVEVIGNIHDNPELLREGGEE